MESSMFEQAAKILREHRDNRRTQMLLAFLAVIVAVSTTVVLTKPGQAMTHTRKVLDCQLEVHEHTKECYDEDKNLICGYADYVVHTHNDDCYDENGKLVCQLPEVKEHKHTDECYKEEKVLTCDKEESEGHKHTDKCYEKKKGKLICDNEEEDHEHSDDCYEWEEVLTCDKEESEGHKHTDKCYSVEKVAVCGELELHTHDKKKCYDEDGNLICGQVELLEHVHDKNCFKTVELEEEEVAKLNEEPAAEESIPTETDLDVATASDTAEESAEAEENTNAEESASTEEADVTENTEPAQPMPALTLEGETEGMVSKVRVTVTAPEGAFPVGTSMKVVPAVGEELVNTIADTVEGEVLRVQAVDITFYDGQGNEVEPLLPIQVTMAADAVQDAGEPVVVHVDDKGKSEVVEQMTAQELESFEKEREKKLEEDEVAFQADSFSVYAIVYTVDAQYDGKTYTYEVESDGSISLSKMLSDLNTSTNQRSTYVTEVQSSDKSLVNIEKKGADWIVSILKSFADGIEPTIAVTFKSAPQVVIKLRMTSQRKKDAVKITDKDGNLLYTSANQPAVYTVLSDLADDDGKKGILNNTNPGLQYKNGTVYTGNEYHVEMLYSFTYGGKQVKFVAPGRDIVFKTASRDATDGFPYRGIDDVAKISFTSQGSADDDNRFIFQGSNSNYTFEDIILDGNNLESQEGGLIKVGDRGAGSVYRAQVYLKNGAVLQNARTNDHDQGGAVYVGYGCELDMETGSLIRNCFSTHGTNSSGGAIYLANGQFYCEGGVIQDCQSRKGAAVDLGGATDCAKSDLSRIYLSQSPEIINNTDIDGKHMNIHLNYDSNEIINVVENMSDSAKVGISVNEDQKIFSKHGVEGTPFATVAEGVGVNPLSFVNDRDTNLTAMLSTTNKHLAVWYYPLIVDAVEDYYVDNVRKSTTILKSNDYYVLDRKNDYTSSSLSEEYLTSRGIQLSDFTEFDYMEVEEHTDVSGKKHPAVAKVTNLKFEDYGNNGGRRWLISADNGKTWDALMGRKLTIHYKKQVRLELNVQKEDSADQSIKLSGVKFELERADSANGAYSAYTGDFQYAEKNTSQDGKTSTYSYTTNDNGAFKMNLPEGWYRLKEKSAPTGYRAVEPFTFEITVDGNQQSVALTSDDSKHVNFDSQPASAAAKQRADSDKLVTSASGTFTVLDDRAVKVNILEIQEDGNHELRDTWRAIDKVYMTVNGPVTEANEPINLSTGCSPDVLKSEYVDKYKKLHTYYGTDVSDLYDTEVVSLTADQRQGIQVNGSEEKLDLNDQLYFIYFENPVKIPVYYVKAQGTALVEISKENLNPDKVVDFCQASDVKSHIQDNLLGTPSQAVKNLSDLDTNEYYFALGPEKVKEASEFSLSVDKNQDIWFYNAYDGIYFSDHDRDYQVRGTKPHELALYVVYGKRTVPVTVHKVWQDGDGSQVDHSGDTVYFTLTPQGEDAMVNPSPIEGMDEHLFSIKSGTNEEWTTVVDAIPAESYTVSEQLVKGYATTYSQTPDEDGTTVITITNIRGVALPSTGGPGTYLYTIGGTAILVCGLLYGLQLWRRREGAAE